MKKTVSLIFFFIFSAISLSPVSTNSLPASVSNKNTMTKKKNLSRETIGLGIERKELLASLVLLKREVKVHKKIMIKMVKENASIKKNKSLPKLSLLSKRLKLAPVELKYKKRVIKIKENKGHGELEAKNIISHLGFRNKNKEVEKEESWLAIFEKQNIEGQLIKLAKNEDQSLKNKKSFFSNKIVLKKEKNKEESGDKKIIISDKKINNDEMIFIDYSNNDEEEKLAESVNIQQNEEMAIHESEVRIGSEENRLAEEKNLEHVDDESISSVVRNIIAREMKKSKLPTRRLVTQKKNTLLAYNAPIGPKNKYANTHYKGAGYSVQNKKSGQKKDEDLVKSILAATKKGNSEVDKSSQTILSVGEIKLKKSKLGQVVNFELASAHDHNERLSDNGTGFVNLDFNLSGSLSVYRTTILKRGYMRTAINLVLEPGDISYEVPLFSQKTIVDILEQKKIDGRGGFALIELDDQIDKIDLDSDYEVRMMFDKSFKETDAMSEAAYIMFLGISPGNTLLKIETIKEEYAEKVIHIVEDEVLFETVFTVNLKTQRLILMERNILAKDAKELEISGEKIKYFNREVNATHEALNLYSIKVPSLITGMRKYFELSHMEETIYLGTWDKEKVEVPTRGFIENVLAALETEDLKGRCLIQLNLGKEVKDIKIGGETIKGPMNIRHAYLDEDGTMTQEMTELAKKAFFLGDLQGLVNIKIEYLDSTKDFLQTFCSDETYLVEHL